MARVQDDLTVSATIRDGQLWIRQRREFDRQIAQMRDGAEVGGRHPAAGHAQPGGECLLLGRRHAGAEPAHGLHAGRDARHQ